MVYVNTDLTAVQIKKLQKRWNDIIMDREERIRAYNIRSANKEWEISPTESDTTAMSDFGGDWSSPNGMRKVRVIDRFGMILQIFAARAKTQMAQLQIELAWMRYARTLLNRGGAPSFGQVRNMFSGNLMRQDTVEVEIKSAKGQGGKGSIGGAGETQLQVEKYNLKVREARLTDKLKTLQQKDQREKDKRLN